MHGAVGILALVGLITFAFGPRVARICVASVLVLGALGFAYVMFRVITGTI